MSRRSSFTLAPLVEFLDDDLAAVASMPTDELRAGGATDRAGLIARTRYQIIFAHRAELPRTALRGKLESFGIDPLTELGGADLSSLSLAGELFAGADLRRANLTASDLARIDLSGADMRNAELARASLVAANLSGARLDEANLAGADLSDARVAGARFTGALLTDARGVPATVRQAARISSEVAAVLQQLCRLGDTIVAPLRRDDAALGKAVRLILLGEWDEAGSLLQGADDRRTELVKVVLEMLKGDIDIAGRILAEVKAQLRG